MKLTKIGSKPSYAEGVKEDLAYGTSIFDFVPHN